MEESRLVEYFDPVEQVWQLVDPETGVVYDTWTDPTESSMNYGDLHGESSHYAPMGAKGVRGLGKRILMSKEVSEFIVNLWKSGYSALAICRELENRGIRLSPSYCAKVVSTITRNIPQGGEGIADVEASVSRRRSSTEMSALRKKALLLYALGESTLSASKKLDLSTHQVWRWVNHVRGSTTRKTYRKTEFLEALEPGWILATSDRELQREIREAIPEWARLGGKKGYFLVDLENLCKVDSNRFTSFLENLKRKAENKGLEIAGIDEAIRFCASQ